VVPVDGPAARTFRILTPGPALTSSQTGVAHPLASGREIVRPVAIQQKVKSALQINVVVI
jgi:hypothetical protein